MRKSRILSAMISVAMLASCFTTAMPVSAAPADTDAVSVKNDVDAAANLMAVAPTVYDFTAMESAPVYSEATGYGFVGTTSAIGSKTTDAGKADTSVGTGRTAVSPESIVMKGGATTADAAGMVFRIDVDKPGAYRVIVTGVDGTTSKNTAVAVSGMEASRLTSTGAWDSAGLVKKTAPAKWDNNVWSYDYVTGENFIEVEIEGIGGAEVGVASISVAPFEEKEAGDKPTVFVLGDSTQKTYTFEENSMSAYGQVLYQMFDLSKVNVINYSMGGRSMRTNFQEGRFNDVLMAAKPGDYVLIHSAHNDETSDEMSRFGRGTSAGMYENFLKNLYIPAIKAVGAIPVLVTSMPRTSDGVYKENDTKPNGFNPDSPGMMRAAAKADADVKLVELYNGAKKYIDEIGAAETTYIYQSLEAGETAGKTNSGSYANGHPDNKIDGTHYKEAYAKQLARIIAQDIYAQKSDDKLGILAEALSDEVKAACEDNDWTKHVFPEMANDVSTVGGKTQGTNAYYRNQIEKMLQLGIMAKDSAGNFNPKAPMTVGSFAKSLTKAWSLDETVLSDYMDSIEEPEITDAPEITDTPDVTEKPDVTDAPDVTEKPDVTDEPIVTAPPVVDGLNPVTVSKSWVFDDYVGDITSEIIIGEGKDLRIYGADKMAVDANNKTIDGVKYTTRLKLAGTGTFGEDGTPTGRVVEILPGVNGTIKIPFAHSSSTGDPRVLAVKQNGVEIGTKSIDPGQQDIFTCAVSANAPVYIYSQNSGLNFYGVIFEASDGPVVTDVPTDKPTDAPTDKPTDAPTDKPTDKPTDAPTNVPTDAPPTDKPTDEPGETTAPVDAVKVVATYGIDGRLISLTLDTNYKYTGSVEEVPGAKVLVWNNLTDMKPLCDPVTAPAAASLSDATVKVAIDGDAKYTANQVIEAEGITLTIGNDDALKVTKASNIDGYTAYVSGGGNPKDASGSGYIDGKENLPTTGVYFVLNPTQDGMISVAYVLNADKNFFIVEADEASNAPLKDFNGITFKDKVYTTSEFNVKGGKSYYVFCTGSKLGLFGFEYTPGGAVATPAPTPTADPNATPEPELVADTAIDKDAALTREAMAAIVYDAYEAKFGKSADGLWNKPVYMTKYNGTNLSPDDPNYDPNLTGASAQYYPLVGWGALTDVDQFHESLYGKAKEVYNLGLMRSEKGIARGKMVNGTEMEPLTVVTREKAAKELYFLYNLIQDIYTENQVIPGENMAFTLTEELATPDPTKPSYPGGGSVTPGTTTAPTTEPTTAPTLAPGELPEDKAWVSSDAALDAIVLAADADGKAFGPYNGLSGYGKWVKGGSKLTYTHTNDVTYSFDHGWQGGTGGDQKINFYFTPEQACIVTVAYTAQAGRPVYIAQGGTGANYRLAEGMDGATDGHPAVLTADIEDPSKGDVYIVGGSSNKQVYAIFADYYDPNVVVLRNVSGKINYTGSADASAAKIVFTDTNDGTRYEVPFAAEYSVDLRQNRTYNISVEENGQLSETLATTLDTNSVSVAKMDKTHDIDVVAIGLTEVTGEVVVHEYTPNDGATLDLSNVSLTFTAKDDDTYTYTVPAGSIADNKYKVTMMPNHDYAVTATGIDGYTLSALSGSYVMAAGDTAPFKNILITENIGTVEFTNKIEVGADKTYTKISDAITAIKAMSGRPAGEAGRVEIVIDPGHYMEQVIIDTAHVTLKAANENDKPEINWYYGIGYKYYSANGGFYSEDSAVQKTEKNNVDRWGCAVRIRAQYVLMENIKVIDTFNCYITDEEIADGVEPGVYGDVSGKPDRTVEGYDAMSQAATERAAAIAIDNNFFEAYRCEFVSSQDTFYTNTTGSYIKECYIEGGTDYIYGGTQIVFDNCTLAWHGYSDNAKGGYITACSDNGRTFGYLFKNCTVTNSKYFTKNKFAAGGWGRNWGGANCHVVFDDVTIADGVEAPTGWTKMGGPLEDSVIYVNNVHKTDDTPITGSGFNPNGTMEENGYTLHEMYEYFDGWNPPHFDGHMPEKTEYTTTWNFGRGNGAPDYNAEGASSSPISIEGITDNPKAQTLVVDATGGKFNNTSRNDDLAQVNDGTKFIIPVVNGSVITFSAYNAAGTLKINGQSFTSAQNYVYGGPEGTVEAVASGVGYMSYIRVVSPAHPVEATPVPRLTVTFDLGNTDAEGTVPGSEIVEQGGNVTIPANRTLYKEGHTLTGWTDGTNTYAVGTAFTPAASVTLTPVFTENKLPYTGTVDFNAVKNSGAPSVVVGENKTGLYVVQDANGTDLKMGIDTSGNGKFDNGNGDWIQINTNTTLTVPVYAGSKVTVGKTYASETYTINGSEFNGGPEAENTASVEEDGIAKIVITSGGYFTNVKVTYPEGAATPVPEETPAPEETPDPSDGPAYTGGTYAVGTETPIKAGTVIEEVSGITMTFGAMGDADFLIDEGTTFTKGNNVNPVVTDGIPVSGTFYKFEPKTDGNIAAEIVLNANKAFFVTEGAEAITGTLADVEQLLNGVKVEAKINDGFVSFDVKAGKTYYVYCTGSKLGLYGFTFTPAE